MKDNQGNHEQLKACKENEGNSWICILWLWQFIELRKIQVFRISILNTRLIKWLFNCECLILRIKE